VELFLFLVLAFFGPEGFRGHLWPFIDVLREIWPAVTQKLCGFAMAART
jgi:hypothetical protein